MSCYRHRLIVPFVHQVTARFFQVDRAGILFFGRVFEFCHETFEELLVEAGGGITRMFEETDLGMPLVHAEADFKRPICMGDVISVELRVDELRERSIAFGYTLRGVDGGVRATAQLVHAFVARSTFKGTAAPAWFLDSLRRLQLIEQ